MGKHIIKFLENRKRILIKNIIQIKNDTKFLLSFLTLNQLFPRARPYIMSRGDKEIFIMKELSGKLEPVIPVNSIAIFNSSCKHPVTTWQEASNEIDEENGIYLIYWLGAYVIRILRTSETKKNCFDIMRYENGQLIVSTIVKKNDLWVWGKYLNLLENEPEIKCTLSEKTLVTLNKAEIFG